jgi:hypothetical protein
MRKLNQEMGEWMTLLYHQQEVTTIRPKLLTVQHQRHAIAPHTNSRMLRTSGWAGVPTPLY